MSPARIIYELQHTNPETSHIKSLGFFKRRADAAAAIKNFIDMPGFKKYPETFDIIEYEVDKDYHTEGFIAAKHNGGQSHDSR
ncbi:MAG: hypothetical protein KKA05_04960 [Alphaproteobacteria bacterium]|nr:hypothetical protein [Alphaproteobacteria bacterium]